MEHEECIAHLQLIAEHEGNDLSPNDGSALTHAIAAVEKLAWFEQRETYVRALIGAVEDSGVFRDEAQDEWRMLVSWEQDNKKP
jgi:hypothetical protein